MPPPPTWPPFALRPCTNRGGPTTTMANHVMAIVWEKEPSERNKRQDLDHIHWLRGGSMARPNGGSGGAGERGRGVPVYLTLLPVLVQVLLAVVVVVIVFVVVATCLFIRLNIKPGPCLLLLATLLFEILQVSTKVEKRSWKCRRRKTKKQVEERDGGGGKSKGKFLFRWKYFFQESPPRWSRSWRGQLNCRESWTNSCQCNSSYSWIS